MLNSGGLKCLVMAATVTVDIDVRYRDLDTVGHVNNAVYATYLEEARSVYFDRVYSGTYDEAPFVLASLDLSFKRPITGEDRPTVGIRTTNIGRTSLELQYDIDVDGSTAAEGSTTIVFIDPETGESTTIPAEIRQNIVDIEGIDG